MVLQTLTQSSVLLLQLLIDIYYRKEIDIDTLQEHSAIKLNFIRSVINNLADEKLKNDIHKIISQYENVL